MIIKVTKEYKKKMAEVIDLVKANGFEVERNDLWGEDELKFRGDKAQFTMTWQLKMYLPNASLVVE